MINRISFPINPDIITCQIVAPAISGSFTSLNDLLPPWAQEKLGKRDVVSVVMTPVGSPVDLRTNALQPGDQLDSDVPREIPGLNIHGFLLMRSSATVATTVRVMLGISTLAPV